jgi:CRISPR-associated protein Cmr4
VTKFNREGLMPSNNLYWLHTLSPTHVGTGRGVGYIDLPIQRDRVTNWPVIPGSAFKGVWADYFRATDERRKADPMLRAAFGRASNSDNQSNAGALIATDCRLVCLPIRSFRGTFAWCTSPLCLAMLKRDLELVGMTGLPALPELSDDALALHAHGTALVEGDKVFLEDLDLIARVCDAANSWAEAIGTRVFAGDDYAGWRDVFVKRFVVVADTTFDFLTQTGTEVNARVRISDDTKAVEEGALWNEEALPAETILVGLICCTRVYPSDGAAATEEDLIKTYASDPLVLQIGGKATVGRGRVRCIFTDVQRGGDHHADA